MKWHVLVSVDATLRVEVEADNSFEAKKRAEDKIKAVDVYDEYVSASEAKPLEDAL